jgi:hypothetical protein
MGDEDIRLGFNESDFKDYVKHVAPWAKWVSIGTLGLLALVLLLDVTKLLVLSEVNHILAGAVTTVIIMGLVSGFVRLILIQNEQAVAKAGYVRFENDTLAYCRGSRLYLIRAIDTLLESTTQYIITGDIECMNIIRSQVKDSKSVQQVIIPRYFEGLNYFIDTLKVGQ